MSNGYDFFGNDAHDTTGTGRLAAPPQAGQPHPTPTGASNGPDLPTPAVDRWGMPITSSPPPTGGFAPTYAPQQPVWQPNWQVGAQPDWQPAAQRGSSKKLGAGALIAVIALAAGAYVFLTRPHAVSLPDSAGGLAVVTDLPSSTKSDMSDMKKQLAKDHVHDIGTRLYGDATGLPQFLVAAGRIAKADEDVSQVSSQLAAAAAGADSQLSSGQVTSGDATFQCLWQAQGAQPLSVCFWWSQHSLLMGVGIGIDAQATADALAQVKTYASLK
jgi:hypothetical protein